ncbi:MAG TPA: SDR family NAD(P)-dependent oxidoreductase [Aggregatilineaceae bacterium]|jgi:NAD(P)-dependent dehydrogenase (short-subunit alcohol dehydrogenase family)|nr:SDR family NAD(P)-dependent oxidoreductase [Aggregatilineaceae bacterium]
MENLHRFEGKVVVVTGASRGIGEGIALGFAREGADLVVAANEDRVNEVAQKIKDLAVDYHQTIHKSNGRIEIRRCGAIADPVAFEYIRHYEAWADVQTIVRVQRECRVKGKTTVVRVLVWHGS